MTGWGYKREGMITNLPLYLYTTMKSNNYGYANAIGVIIIAVGFVTMTIINKAFAMHEDD